MNVEITELPILKLPPMLRLIIFKGFISYSDYSKYSEYSEYSKSREYEYSVYNVYSTHTKKDMMHLSVSFLQFWTFKETTRGQDVRMTRTHSSSIWKHPETSRCSSAWLHPSITLSKYFAIAMEVLYCHDGIEKNPINRSPPDILLFRRINWVRPL